MEIIVISLADAQDRRRNATRQLRALGLPFVFLDALRGKEAVRQGVFRTIDEREFLLNTGRLPAPDEIGCFASHRRAWKECAKRDEPVMIMEDDFLLRADFRDALQISSGIIREVGFLRLQTTLRSREVSVSRLDGFYLERFTKPPHGLMCYCLSPKVARRFVEQTMVLDAPVDVFTKKYWEHGQTMYALTPFTVEESDHHADSSIHGRTKARKSAYVALRRFLRKCRWFGARHLFNLRKHTAESRRTVGGAQVFSGPQSRAATSDATRF